MKVVILCGGIGARLREETEFRPKPMVFIGNRPILWHIMKSYAHYGFNEFVLALGYKGDIIKDYFYHYELTSSPAVTIELGRRGSLQVHNGNTEAGWKITLVETGEATLKGGRLKKVEPYIDGDTFLMTYGDGVANVDIPAALDFHGRHGKAATVTGVSLGSRFGEMKVTGDRVERFMEKPREGTDLVNGGYFVFHRRVFDFLSVDDECDLEVGALERMAEMGELMVYRHKGFWACMDTIRDREYLNRLWDDNRAEWKVW